MLSWYNQWETCLRGQFVQRKPRPERSNLPKATQLIRRLLKHIRTGDRVLLQQVSVELSPELSRPLLSFSSCLGWVPWQLGNGHMVKPCLLDSCYMCVGNWPLAIPSSTISSPQTHPLPWSLWLKKKEVVVEKRNKWRNYKHFNIIFSRQSTLQHGGARGVQTHPPPSSEELLTGDSCWESESWFSLKVRPLRSQPCSSELPTPIWIWAPQVEFGGLYKTGGHEVGRGWEGRSRIGVVESGRGWGRRGGQWIWSKCIVSLYEILKELIQIFYKK